MRAMIRLLFMALVSGLLFGCATHYPNTLDKNLTVNINLEKNGGILTSAEAVAGVNEIGKDCSNDYKGFVELEPGANEIGLALGQPTLLLVEISHSTFGGGDRSVQRGAMITPKAGSRYQIDVNYVDAMFDFRLYEVGRSGKKPLEVVTNRPGCKS